MKIIINEVPFKNNSGKPNSRNYKKGWLNLHWSERAIYKDMIKWLIYQKTYNDTNPNTILYKKAKVTFDIYFKVNQNRDIQNYLGGGLIAWLDALVDQNIIVDDNYDCIGQPIVNFHIDKDNPRTEIIIEGG